MSIATNNIIKAINNTNSIEQLQWLSEIILDAAFRGQISRDDFRKIADAREAQVVKLSQ